MTGYLGVLDHLPDACRTLRNDRGLSLRDAAARIGMSYSELSRFETGTGNPTLVTLQRVAHWVDLNTAPKS